MARGGPRTRRSVAATSALSTAATTTCDDEKTDVKKVSKDPNVNWRNNDIQFPRLLAEMFACIDFSAKQKKALCESMDLEWADVVNVMARADEVWQDIKRRT